MLEQSDHPAAANKDLATVHREQDGQLAVNGYDGKIDWRADVYNLELILPPTEAFPDLLALSREQSAKIQAADSDDEKKRLIAEMQKSREEDLARQRAFYATDKGREYYFQNKRYALNFAQDGSFRVEDIPGGKYRLRVDLREGGGDSPMRFSAPRIANLKKSSTSRTPLAAAPMNPSTLGESRCRPGKS